MFAVDALAKRIADAQQSVAVESDAASGRRTSLRVAVKKGVLNCMQCMIPDTQNLYTSSFFRLWTSMPASWITERLRLTGIQCGICRVLLPYINVSEKYLTVVCRRSSSCHAAEAAEL